jgi:gamma-glutamyltranspeptidase/glutathione hydrolase
MEISQAIEAPRIHHQWLPDITSFEQFGVSSDTRSLYEMMGHQVKVGGSQGRAMGIFADHENKIIKGAADTRSPDGMAAGY